MLQELCDQHHFKSLLEAAHYAVFYLADEGEDFNDGLSINGNYIEIDSKYDGQNIRTEVRKRIGNEVVLEATYKQKKKGNMKYPHFALRDINIVSYKEGEEWEALLLSFRKVAEHQRACYLKRDFDYGPFY